MIKHLPIAAFLAAGALFAFGSPIAIADDEPTLTLSLKNHHFDPATPEVPAGKRIKLVVTNGDTTPAEVESDDFKLETVVPPGKTITVMFGPLKAGSYEIHDEFHEDESKTKLTAK